MMWIVRFCKLIGKVTRVMIILCFISSNLKFERFEIFLDSKQLYLRFVFEIWRFRNNLCGHVILNLELRKLESCALL